MIIPTIILVVGTLISIGLMSLGLFVRRLAARYRIATLLAGFLLLILTAVLVLTYHFETGYLLPMPYGCLLMGLLTLWLESLAVPRRSNGILAGAFLLLIGIGLWIAAISKLLSATTR